MQETEISPAAIPKSPLQSIKVSPGSAFRLLGFSFLLLFFEVALIRFIPANVQVVSFFINLILIAAFLGMGVGMILQSRGRETVFGFAPLLLLLIGVVQYFSNVWVEKSSGQGEYFWSVGIKPSDLVATWGTEPVVFIIFVLSMAVFIPLGSGIAREFDKFKPLVAYSLNILGSLLGLAVFSLFSWFSAPPIMWFSFGFVFFIALVLNDRKVLWSTLCFPIILFLIFGMVEKDENQAEIWSPYYKINFSKHKEHLDLSVNGSFHQHALNFEEPYISNDPFIRRVREDYLAPYHFARSLDDVLILGSGTGNDVAMALSQGAKQIDAVEIDPEILRLGKQYHYQKPYSDPRVTVFNDDARAYLKKSEKLYDVVVLGTLDSQTLLSSMSSLRLDNYVYTVESFRSIREHLKPSGILILYHMSGTDFISEKIYTTLMDAFSEQPMMRHISKPHLFNFTFVAGWSAFADKSFWNDPAVAVFSGNFGHEKDDEGNIIYRFKNPVDDWPYLYLKHPRIPSHYLTVGSFILIFSVLVVALSARGGPGGWRTDWTMFFLGTGFLLLETKSVTEMSLLYGSTWLVNVLVFSSILVTVLLANGAVLQSWVSNRNLQFSLLFATLLICFLVPVESILKYDLVWQWVFGSFLVALPVLFSSILFAIIFQSRNTPALALGYNVLGAVLGGLLEYNAMVLGTKPLYLISMIMYLGAYYFYYRESTV